MNPKKLQKNYKIKFMFLGFLGSLIKCSCKRRHIKIKKCIFWRTFASLHQQQNLIDRVEELLRLEQRQGPG